MSTLEIFRRSRLSGRHIMGSITAVDLGRRKECKNPLDHVYGLLRFADDIDVELRERISIDYSPDAGTCWWKIFTMYGKIAIRSRPGLELLCYAYSQHSGLTVMVPKSQLYKGSRVYRPRVHAWSLPEGNASFDGITYHIATKSDHFGAVEIVGAQIDTIACVSLPIF
jgi:hypothetical protein